MRDPAAAKGTSPGQPGIDVPAGPRPGRLRRPRDRPHRAVHRRRARWPADLGVGIALFIDEMQDVRPPTCPRSAPPATSCPSPAAPLIVVGAGCRTCRRVLSASKSYSERLFRYAPHRPARPRGGRPGAASPPAESEDVEFDAGRARRALRGGRRLPLLRPGLRQGRPGTSRRAARSPPTTSQVAAPEAEARARRRLLRQPLRAGHPGRARLHARHGRLPSATSRSPPRRSPTRWAASRPACPRPATA